MVRESPASGSPVVPLTTARPAIASKSPHGRRSVGTRPAPAGIRLGHRADVTTCRAGTSRPAGTRYRDATTQANPASPSPAARSSSRQTQTPARAHGDRRADPGGPHRAGRPRRCGDARRIGVRRPVASSREQIGGTGSNRGATPPGRDDRGRTRRLGPLQHRADPAGERPAHVKPGHGPVDDHQTARFLVTRTRRLASTDGSPVTAHRHPPRAHAETRNRPSDTRGPDDFGIGAPDGRPHLAPTDQYVAADPVGLPHPDEFGHPRHPPEHITFGFADCARNSVGIPHPVDIEPIPRSQQFRQCGRRRNRWESDAFLLFPEGVFRRARRRIETCGPAVVFRVGVRDDLQRRQAPSGVPWGR